MLREVDHTSYLIYEKDDEGIQEENRVASKLAKAAAISANSQNNNHDHKHRNTTHDILACHSALVCCKIALCVLAV